MGLTMKGAWSKYGPAGLLVMLSVGTALGSSKTLSASTVFNSENFQDHLVLLYKGAYVAYSGGVRCLQWRGTLPTVEGYVVYGGGVRCLQWRGTYYAFIRSKIRRELALFCFSNSFKYGGAN